MLWFSAAALALLWFVLCRHLSAEWSANDQYSYGWFVPFFAAFLFWLRWEDRPAPEWANGECRTSNAERRILVALGALALFLLFPIRLFELGNQDWRPLGWLHAIAVALLTLAAVYWTGGRTWLRHFVFPIAFFLVAVPWITPVEQPIVQGLMRVVAVVAAETVTLLGVPAQLEGNIIRVSTGLVGVDEACSGVRSLQTSLMIGLLFGELKRLRAGRRILLVVGALALSLVANFARAFLLVWISATGSAGAAERWHDPLGYAIVGIVFLGSMLLSLLLAPGNRDDAQLEATPTNTGGVNAPHAGHTRWIPLRWSLPALIWILLVETGTAAWYRAHEGDLVERPRWSIRLPADAEGLRELPIAPEVENMLRFDEGRQVTWSMTGSAGDRRDVVLFYFRWEPGGETALRARSHRPDVCLPSVGWRQVDDHGLRQYPLRGDFTLPFRHFSFVGLVPGREPRYAEAFFCVREDKVLPKDSAAAFAEAKIPVSDWSRAERLRVVREGLRNTGQQVLQLTIVSRAPMSEGEAEAQISELLRKIVVIE